MSGQDKTNIYNMIVRAVLDTIEVQEDGTILTKQSVLDGDEVPDVELFQQYGYASVPLKDAEALTLFLDGDRAHGITIATEDARYRIKKMKGGEVAIYTDEGDVIHFKRGREISVDTMTLNVKVGTKAIIDSPIVELTGDLKVDGAISAKKVSDATGSMDELRIFDDIHVHSGVTTGPGSSGPAVPIP